MEYKMHDIELDRKKCQRQAWMYSLYFVELKIQEGLTVNTLFTETPTEELKTLLEYAIKGMEQELKEMNEADERQAALLALNEADECFQPETLEELRSYFPLFRSAMQSSLKNDIPEKQNSLSDADERQAALEIVRKAIDYSHGLGIRDNDFADIHPIKLREWKIIYAALQSPRVPVIEGINEAMENIMSKNYPDFWAKKIIMKLVSAYAELSKTKQSSQAAPQKGFEMIADGIEIVWTQPKGPHGGGGSGNQVTPLAPQRAKLGGDNK